MTEEKNTKKKMGPHVKRLVCQYASVLAVPPGGGMKEAIATFTTPGKLQANLREACKWVEDKLAAVKAAPDNPFGDDDEAIAKHILEKIDERKSMQKLKAEKETIHGDATE